MTTSSRSGPAVFVLGTGGCNALGVLRAFGRRHIPVFAFGHRPTATCTWSRYGKVLDSPPFGAGDALAEFLVARAGEHNDPPVLLATSDEAVLHVLSHGERLERFLRLSIGPPGAVRALVDKAEFAAAARRADVDGPATRAPASHDEALAAARDIGYPCLLKPATPHLFGPRFGLKAFLVRDDAELADGWRRIKDLPGPMLVQEIVPGEKSYLWYGYYDRHGRRVGGCGYWKLRRWPTDFGNATLASVEPRLDLVEQVDRLVGEVGYHGPAEAEFLLDARTGRWRIIEINARTVMQNRLPAALGCDIEYLAYLDATGRDLEPQGLPAGDMLWTETHKDFAAAFSERGITLRRWLRSRQGRKVYAYFAADDPLPALARLPEAATTVAGTLCRRWFPGLYRRLRGSGSRQDDSHAPASPVETRGRPDVS